MLLLANIVYAAIPASYGFDYPIGNKDNLDGWYTSLFLGDSWSSYYGHLGEDYLKNTGSAKGEMVYSASSGVVYKIYTGSPNSWGGVVIIKHIPPSGNSFSVSGITLPNSGEISTNTVYTLYGHLDLAEIYVQENNNIAKGDPIGKIGVVSAFPTPHLHFEVKNQTAIDTEWQSGVGHGYSGTSNYAPNHYKPSNFIETNRPASWSFNIPNNFEGWTASGIESGDGKKSVEGGRFFINPERVDPYIYSAALSLDASYYDSLEVNMASNAPNGVGQVYFTTSASPGYSEDKRVEFYVTYDGDWHTYTIYMKNHPLWQGTITGIRIDPAALGNMGTDPSDTIGFDWIKVIKTDKKPKIISADLDYSVYNPGSTIALSYWIENPFANNIPDTKLYAAIRPSGSGESWLEDGNWLNENVVTLGSATNYETWRYNRNFQIPWSASAGYYDVYLRIFNQNTNDLYDYKYLTSAFVIESTDPIIIDPTPTPTPTDNPPPPPTPTSTPTPTPTQTPTPTPTPTPDTSPPASIISLRNITYARTNINWNWTDPEDADFSKVIIYFDGTFQTNVTKGTQFYNASNLTPGASYTISAHTADLAGNVNQTWVNHTAKTAPMPESYDLNKDDVVDITDLIMAAHHFGETAAEPYQDCDVNKDGVVDIFDLALVAQNLA